MHKLIQWFNSKLKIIVLLLFSFPFFIINLYAQQDAIDSQPEILFKYDKLKESQEKFKLQVDFNKAILLLEREEYSKAIKIFKKTSQILKIPSFLNIGIAYFKMNQIENASLYLNNIFEYKEAASTDTYSYISKNKE